MRLISSLREDMTVTRLVMVNTIKIVFKPYVFPI